MDWRPSFGGFAAGMIAVACGPGSVGVDDSSSSAATETAAADDIEEGSEEDSEEDSDTEAETGDGDGDEVPPEVPDACPLVRVDGDARLGINPDTTLGTRLFTLHPGSPQTAARVMTMQIEVFGAAHSNYRARSFELEGPWPNVVETGPALVLTQAGHSLSRLAALAEGSGRYGYVWTGDPDGTNKYDTKFSILDADAWTVGGTVEIESSTNPGFVDLLRTSSATRLLTTTAIDSYGSTPMGETSGYALGVLDIDGNPLVDPAPILNRTPLPGSSVRSFWAGDRVHVAIAHNDCDGADELCFPHAVVLARPLAADQHGVAVAGFEATHVVDGLPSTEYLSRPQLAVAGGLTWMTWYEGESENSTDEHRSFRALVLDSDGNPIAWPPNEPSDAPITFMADTAMSSWPSLLVSEYGITVGYLSDESVFVIRHHDFELQPLGEPISIALDSIEARYPSMTALADPRGLLLAWAERIDGQMEMRMVRLDCP